MVNTTRTLAEIIDEAKREEPVLFTRYTEDVIEEIGSFEHKDIIDYDLTTNDMRRNARSDNHSIYRQLYARRIVAAFYFMGIAESFEDRGIVSALYGFDRASSAAYRIANVRFDYVEHPRWLLRCMIARSKSIEICDRIYSSRDLFYSLLYSAESGLILLKLSRDGRLDGVDFPENWPDSRIEEHTIQCIRRFKDLVEKGFSGSKGVDCLSKNVSRIASNLSLDL